jgi:hypothetical protein
MNKQINKYLKQFPILLHERKECLLFYKKKWFLFLKTTKRKKGSSYFFQGQWKNNNMNQRGVLECNVTSYMSKR